MTENKQKKQSKVMAVLSEKTEQPPVKFKGYTLEELKHRRTLALIKKELIKEEVIVDFMTIKEKIPLINGKSNVGKFSSGIIGKIAKGLSYTDYIMLGISAFNSGKKIFSLFRKKKK